MAHLLTSQIPITTESSIPNLKIARGHWILCKSHFVDLIPTHISMIICISRLVVEILLI